jgi:DNA polymerase-1
MKIRICCQIHDAQYYLVKADTETVKWFNDTLPKEVQWQDHPDIAHPTVGLSGESSIFYPTWAEEHTIANGASLGDIKRIGQKIAEEHLNG